MLYVVFILAVFVTVLYFTGPEFILQKKFRGQDLYEILSDEEHNHTLRLLGRGLHAVLYSLVYYPTSLIAIPLIILWAISNDVGLRVVSFIAIAAVLVLLFQFGQWLWQTISGNKGKADILTDDGKRYRGKLLSEEKIVTFDVVMPDIPEGIHISGVLLDEDDRKMKIRTSDGVQNLYKGSLDLETLEKRTVFKTEIRLKDGSKKTGRRVHILGERPFKEFLANFPDLILVLYLWYLVVVQLIN
jgi:hypothetical protein